MDNGVGAAWLHPGGGLFTQGACSIDILLEHYFIFLIFVGQSEICLIEPQQVRSSFRF